MARVEAPNKGYSGTGPAGVKFTDGVANTNDEAALNYFRAAGYTVDGDAPGPVTVEEVDAGGTGVEVVGTALRDAAVDPRPADFLAPINAGQGNPHGPTVISPEIHTSGPKGIRPGVVHVDDNGKQEAREQEFAKRVLADQVDVGEANTAEVPDLDARGDLGLSDPGSALVGAEQATDKPTGAEGDAAAGSKEDAAVVVTADGVEHTGTLPVGAIEPPKQAEAKAEWVDFAINQGADEAWARDEKTTKAQLIERYGA